MKLVIKNTHEPPRRFKIFILPSVFTARLSAHVYKTYRSSDIERESKVAENISYSAHGTGIVGGGPKSLSRSAMHARDHLTCFREGTRGAEFHC